MGGDIMLLDEILSPTFEDLILVWCLEKVHTKSHKMSNGDNKTYSVHKFKINKEQLLY